MLPWETPDVPEYRRILYMKLFVVIKLGSLISSLNSTTKLTLGAVQQLPAQPDQRDYITSLAANHRPRNDHSRKRLGN